MNLYRFTEAVYVSFNPVLILLLAIWLGIRLVNALGLVLGDVTTYLRQRWRH